MAGVDSFLSFEVRLDVNGASSLAYNDWGLIFSGKPNTSLNLSSWTVTQIGHEVFSLLMQPDERKNLIELEKAVPEYSAEQIELVQLGAIVGPQTRKIISREMLRQKPTAESA